MTKATLLLVATLAGCQAQPQPTSSQIDPPAVGRFQMERTGDDFVILDTANGQLRRCWFKVSDKLSLTCGDSSERLD